MPAAMVNAFHVLIAQATVVNSQNFVYLLLMNQSLLKATDPRAQCPISLLVSKGLPKYQVADLSNQAFFDRVTRGVTPPFVVGVCLSLSEPVMWSCSPT